MPSHQSKNTSERIAKDDRQTNQGQPKMIKPKKQRTSVQMSGDKDINQVIGARIAAKRRAACMDMAEFSEKIGVSVGQLSRYESGETPLRITMVTFIARHLGCKAGELVDGE